MKRTDSSIGPLNIYSGSFFGLWLLAMLTSVGWRVSDGPSYKVQLEEWHQKRVKSLKSESGWLNVAGLYWLKEGANKVGSDTGNDITFPSGKAPEQVGTFQLTNGTVFFTPAPGAAVLADRLGQSTDGSSVKPEPLLTTETIFSPESKKPVTLQHGSLRWFIIKRGNKYGVRLRDLESPALNEFHGIDRFPVDETWRLKARLEVPSEPKTIPIMDVIGQLSQYPLAGTLVFERGGKTYRLDAAGEGEKLFILFGDPTNTHDTYGAGRFLYADKAGPDGTTTLDFNQAINPPCAFTTFATCPLPPKQNKLALAVTAGEKRYGDH
ncbi:DUF1684 domain-containing protein [Spirosoma sp. KCTC 42546]|uniref:DUF1684 domain-containing protein n=1 Tax=Spirosoma sp. KCTC 42546 TaxID=2520506 RepID=UPI001159E1D0|nr:DUF1684 domain-containing protein [Spirosoma sp. KCTC 42546]QDK82815.1 DUF1684 domain-containing protein [Spirosoma sp. KCTC 42546]